MQARAFLLGARRMTSSAYAKDPQKRPFIQHRAPLATSRSNKTNLCYYSTDLIHLKPKEAIGGYIGNSGVNKYEFELSTSCRLLSRYLRTQFTSLVQNLLQVDLSSVPTMEDVRNEVDLIKERQRVHFFNTRSLNFVICDVPLRVFDELRSNIGNTSDFRVFLSMDLVQESELSSQLTKRALQRTTLDNPFVIFVSHLTSKEDFAFQCESPDVSLFNRQSLQADYQLAFDCLAFLYAMQSRLKLYRKRAFVMRNVLEKFREATLRKCLLENAKLKEIEETLDEVNFYRICYRNNLIGSAIEQMNEVYIAMKDDRNKDIIRDEDSLQDHEYTRNQTKAILEKSREPRTDVQRPMQQISSGVYQYK
ncbi:hypothetical protein CAPTEDRAFT_196426 [Capitella teleta]|uniref:Uncharacterized protein n=1 Tax=Capitella teleta TaxID=283909 RepID=R7TG10_CAPTE|nr:hypothetical protein CAPTEDRAFT_196426 [Capitella teleta]|eukprot:ELT90481.1 hypothetical protein CAPTEDRAFT_196426 [Capitella teleta]